MPEDCRWQDELAGVVPALLRGDPAQNPAEALDQLFEWRVLPALARADPAWNQRDGFDGIAALDWDRPGIDRLAILGTVDILEDGGGGYAKCPLKVELTLVPDEPSVVEIASTRDRDRSPCSSRVPATGSGSPGSRTPAGRTGTRSS